MTKKEFYTYIMDNTIIKNEVEEKLIKNFMKNLNEYFIQPLFEEVIKQRILNYKIINEIYENLIMEEAVKRARKSKIVFPKEDLKYKYDCFTMLTNFYYQTLKKS